MPNEEKIYDAPPLPESAARPAPRKVIIIGAGVAGFPAAAICR